jgi:hypothetical protein
MHREQISRNKRMEMVTIEVITHGETTMVGSDWYGWSQMISFAVLKSAILGLQLSSSSTLEGFKSLWTTLWSDPAWRYATPCAMPWIISNLCLQFNVARSSGSPVVGANKASYICKDGYLDLYYKKFVS